MELHEFGRLNEQHGSHERGFCSLGINICDYGR